MERGCRKGHGSGWGQFHVTWSSLQPQVWGCSSGLEAQRRGPRARVCQRGGVAFAVPGSPAVPPASLGEPTGPAAPGGCGRRRVASANHKVLRRGEPVSEQKGGRGRQCLANGVQRFLQETNGEYRAWGALLCVCIRLEWRERQWEGGCRNGVPVEGKERSDRCADTDLEAWGGGGGKICKSCICLFWP